MLAYNQYPCCYIDAIFAFTFFKEVSLPLHKYTKRVQVFFLYFYSHILSQIRLILLVPAKETILYFKILDEMVSIIIDNFD